MGYPPGCPGCSVGQATDFSSFSPFNDAAHYHSYCQITNWGDQGQVKGDFWKEFGDAAGVFQIGEVDNGDPAYVGPYQNYLTATLNYPFYWTFKDVFGDKKSMKEITGRLSQEWVPIVYYGTEQAYNGGNDPDNRNSLWPNFNTGHDMFKFISSVAKFRNGLGSEFYESQQNEKWADDSFYAFTRGTNQEVLVATTNQGSGSTQQRTIPNLPYSDGQELTNVLDTSDKVTAHGGSLTVTITNGQPKVYTTKQLIAEDKGKVTSNDDKVNNYSGLMKLMTEGGKRLC
ncbi:hypothetical protein EB796_021315 [Bugula neritina]|uniref:Alpha-amylase domain-containing protein n=1 Tax=Bugula neritina TaxID=10212 RepID=A0A7J7J2M8_BUGNE|nr:hypothetical protein EB796_021315 [Bugula neritina]